MNMSNYVTSALTALSGGDLTRATQLALGQQSAMGQAQRDDLLAVPAAPPPPPPTLKRVLTLPAPDTLALDESLAKQAADKLGYTRMSTGVSDSRLAVLLTTALQQLEILPFDRQVVEDYKTAVLAQKNRPFGRRLYHWRQAPLAGYPNAIPEYVLHTALRIHDACPEAVFTVEDLAYKDLPLPADPFLIASAGSAFYYVDVWDEPGFMAERRF